MINNRCRGCSKKCETIYCDECAKTAKCPHGNKFDECDKCYAEGDIAFDEARERGR